MGYWRIRVVNYDLDDYYTNLALKYFEHDISMICSQDQWQVIGYTPEDLAQEMRFVLWRQLPKTWNPKKSGLRTWSIKVMKDRIRDLKKESGRHKRKIHYYTTELKDN